MPGCAKSSSGISIPRPVVRSGSSSRKACRGIRGKRFVVTKTSRASGFFRTNGCVVDQCDVGCRKVMRIVRFIRLRRAAARAYRSRASISTTSVSITKRSAIPCPKSSFRAARIGCHLVQPGRVVCVWRSIISHNIGCLFTAPKLLEALCEKISLKKAGITGVFCGGTEMTPQFHRFAVEELLEGAYFAPTYGNTLMGLAVHKPRVPEDNYAIIYYPPRPRALVEVVDPDDPERVVNYGETGRVRLTTLTKEFFMPRFLERDEAEREPPCEQYPWDGVRNVRPFSKLQASVVEGVY